MPRAVSGRATPASRSSSGAAASVISADSPVAMRRRATPTSPRGDIDTLMRSPTKGVPAKVRRAATAPRRRIAGSEQLATLLEFQTALPEAQVGHGTHDAPFDLPLRDEPNADGCIHCPTDHCDCILFEELFNEAVREAKSKRIVEIAGKNHLCAKSVLPPFVTRMVALLDLQPDDTFYDLGSGNGSVVFQAAFMAGCDAVGVELSAHNAELSRDIWRLLQPKLEAATGRRMPRVTIIDGDLTQVIHDDAFGQDGNIAIWTANLLMPRSVTHYMAERFRLLPPGARIMCFDDLYPHGRASCRSRDPEAFEKFDMTDFVWPPMSVEWMSGGGGKFYRHIRV